MSNKNFSELSLFVFAAAIISILLISLTISLFLFPKDSNSNLNLKKENFSVTSTTSTTISFVCNKPWVECEENFSKKDSETEKTTIVISTTISTTSTTLSFRKTCTKNFHCEIGEKCITVYSFKEGVKFHQSYCFKEEISCNSNEGCILGLKCYPYCFSKNFREWYNESAVSCIWDENSYKKVECECINNLCEIKSPPKCNNDKDCSLGLRCYPGGYCQ